VGESEPTMTRLRPLYCLSEFMGFGLGQLKFQSDFCSIRD